MGNEPSKKVLDHEHRMTVCKLDHEYRMEVRLVHSVGTLY